MPSAPGRLGGARQHHEALAGRQIVAGAEDAVGAGDQRIVGLQRNEDRAVAALVTRSRPWSKNWPKNVIHALNGADRPSSGVMFGMKKTWLIVGGAEDAVQAGARDDRGRPRSQPTAAGLLAVWSTIRLRDDARIGIDDVRRCSRSRCW